MRKKMIVIIFLLFFQSGIWGLTVLAATVGNDSDNKEPIHVFNEYQMIIDRLNAEYQYSMTFSASWLKDSRTMKTLLTLSLYDFEKELRKNIEDDIIVNDEAQKILEKMEQDNLGQEVPYLGKSYRLPTNISYLSSTITGE